MIELPNNKYLILFDGICNLCNNSVNYIIRKDKKNRFVFAAIQSEIGGKIISELNIDTSKTDSIILLRNRSEYHFKSTAALKIAQDLQFPTNLAIVFLVIPAFIRNWVYDIIARNRYKWYGKREACMIPTPELKAKFLE
ncbi:MAG: DUF393 domain-containing protein [Bacteroidia bacterium]|nr:DUF393 domain-containing protein [Bacteroidia bacterium]MBT8269654.1 DUF393 domain-containing protein [Bacteroidia bacterium]NNK69406.1 DUF393 domain-containing protein [Flavobacteriaceae bacterium]NNL80725.1 DUF393 domain-containing protein [Flavobacteriaceae bacterium]